MAAGADLFNAGVSYWRGDKIGAGLSLAAMAPYVGIAAMTTKLGVKTADEVFDATKRGKPDFIVSRDGAVVPNSPAAARQSLENAGFGGRKISNPSGTESGTIHNIPGMKMDVRIMEGGPVHPARVVTSRQGTPQLVNPATGRNFGNVPKAEQRARSHIPFSE